MFTGGATEDEREIYNKMLAMYNEIKELYESGELNGKSAYEIAVENGFEGTEEEWLESLIGPQGPIGPQGIHGEQGEQGAQGPQGEPGKTPVLGVDYWTEADKQEIVTETTNEVLQQVNGVDFHICTPEEVGEDGKPNIQNPDKSTFYLVSSGDDAPNLFIEWVYVNGAWEQFGSATIDLTGYVKNTDYATAEVGGVVKVGVGGRGMGSSNGEIYIVKAQNAAINAKSNNYQPIVPATLDYAVKVGITTNTEILTDEEKTAAQTWLGVTELIGDISTVLDAINGEVV